ncbi:precorrin-2 dehydrogenase/sirohydrochlorin ferrochelatase [Thermosporothrix hazakensis]|jgi:precorrin-2 dehydrogenase/sirohydrochlorin ferrochelatase|uniref:precorrin-2 dehydrogenase n=2 Tax=Thermosporothrix TaxID=768650 RepID=A0A326U6R3_THEHA|nr:bifunctional precorrin-2 dehydrogenase/sirohydrochlorin ferrochelatase [Thermosporothrix hazakensis]PZW26297.1 precorrin-2 dehydrogenase/sirohydrochlorin ferrochelatase [Thermosporothrix hazakensis]BBH90699.1 precorrin-2 oxidase [Thermosporothrix sp. COM3]GCE48750.1 precorrin-2 oxidase [Thermosporothrix hazakensis]
MPKYYPVMLDVRQRSVIVVGGNTVAAEKTQALVSCGAHVTVIAPELCTPLQEMAERSEIVWRQKVYERGDLATAFVVVAATNDSQQIEDIWQETQERGQQVNIVDVPARCTFIVPSILRRGQLTIAVSTEGASPSLAKRIRQQLEQQFPPAYEHYLQLAAVVRVYLRQHQVSYDERDRFFGDYFASEILQLLAQGAFGQAISQAAALLRAYGITVPESTLFEDMGFLAHSAVTSTSA